MNWKREIRSILRNCSKFTIQSMVRFAFILLQTLYLWSINSKQTVNRLYHVWYVYQVGIVNMKNAISVLTLKSKFANTKIALAKILQLHFRKPFEHTLPIYHCMKAITQVTSFVHTSACYTISTRELLVLQI